MSTEDRTLAETVIDTISIPMHVIDAEHRIVHFNQAFHRWCETLNLKLTVTDVAGRDLLDVFPFLTTAPGEYQQVFDTGIPLVTQSSIRIEGRDICTETSKTPIVLEGRVQYVITTVRDVTERKQAEEALTTYARQQAALVQISTDLAGALDEEQVCQSVVRGLHNSLSYDYLGIFLVDETTGERVVSASEGWPDAPSDWRIPAGQGLSERPLLDGQLHYTPDVTSDPRYVPGITGGSEVDVPIRVGDQVVGVLVIEEQESHASDEDDFAVLTAVANQAGIALQRARQHQALREAETRYRGLFDRIPVGLYRSAPDGQFLEVNAAFVAMLGYADRESMLAVNAVDLYADAGSRGEWQSSLSQDGIVRFETKLCQRDGTVIWARDSARAIRDADGQVLYYEGSLEDITERKGADESLQEAYAEMGRKVEERTAELRREVAERERLQQEIIEAQRQALRELSTPIIPIMDRIIVMPLVGNIDSMRARDITRSLLAGIREHRGSVVILDITGVPIVDSGVADHLNRTIQAARLKGARTIITGISDAVAETIVDLGIDWSGVETLSDLQSGLFAALQSLGVKLTRERADGVG